MPMKNIVPILASLAFFCLLVLCIVYLSRRFAWYFNVRAKWLLYVGFTFSILLCIFGIMLVMQSHSTSLLLHVFTIVTSVGLGVFIYLLLSTLFVDILHFVVKIPSIYYGILTITLTTVVSMYGLINAYHTTLVKQDINIAGLTKEMKIMQFSDVHLGQFWGKGKLQKMVDITKATDAEAVVITGDLFDGRYRFDDATIEPLTQLDIPVYFVAGNHDGYTGENEIKTMLARNGIIVLSNELVHLGELQIIGLDYMLAEENTNDMMHAPLGSYTIKSILPLLGIDKEKPSILLHHNPIGEEYANQAGIDLYLAGHTHAGQLFPITLINNKLFKYNNGLYSYNDTQIYVSDGSGTFGPPMRVGTCSEITLITLQAKKTIH